jgi:hypothetical protein
MFTIFFKTKETAGTTGFQLPAGLTLMAVVGHQGQFLGATSPKP